MSLQKISERNIKTFYIVESCRSLVFIIPMWIAFLQNRISTSEIAIYVSMLLLTQLLLELPTGAFADLVGKRVTIIIAYGVDAIQYLLFGFAHTFVQFIVLAAISGLAEALRSGSLEAIVYDSLKQDGKEESFRKVMANQGTRFQIGLILATLIGGYVAPYWAPLPFILSGIPLVIAALMSYRFIEPKIDLEIFTLKNYLWKIKMGSMEAFKTVRHRYMSLYYIAVGSISWMCATYFSDYVLIDLGFDTSMRGVISSGIRIINVVLIYKLLSNEKLFSFRNTIIFFPIIMVLGLLPGQWLFGVWGIPFVGIVMMSSTARWILLGKYTNAVFESKYRATAISTLSMAIGIVYVIGVTISGPIMERYGDSRLIYTLLGILSLITLPPLAYKVLKNYE